VSDEPFTLAALSSWLSGEAVRPPMPSLDDLDRFPRAASFNLATTTAGCLVRLSTVDGGVVEVMLNPVVATNLAIKLVQDAKLAGWIDGNGRFAIPKA
jgi:hypothetical protein